jgi:histidine triad (HIT) family protein
MAEPDCIFCQIAQKQKTAELVYEDEYVVAFHDAKPAAPIHMLIVPKEHIPTLNDIPKNNNILAHIGQVARIISEQAGVAHKGYRFFINVNKGGGQVIFHLHAHVISKSTPDQ